MEKPQLESLADMVIQQYQEMPLEVPRVNLDRDKLIGVLGKATGYEHKKRMQFTIPHDEAENMFSQMDGSGKLILRSFYPRRIFTTYDTAYRPTRIEKLAQMSEEKLFSNKKARFDAEVCCRLMRRESEITDIRKRSYEAGNGYGIMVRITEELDIIDAPPYHGGNQKVVLPLFFIPGASKEDLDTLAKFSIKLQRSSQADIDHFVKNSVFERNLYE